MTDIYVQKNGRPTAEDLLGTEYRIDAPVSVNLTSPGVDDLAAEIDKVKAKLLNANYTINLSAGSWPGDHDITDILTVDSAFFKISGDLRAHIGSTYPQAANIINGSPYGSGQITLAKTDTNQITVSRATTNPDFAGIVAGDKVFIRHNSGADYYEISSITNGNEINLITAAPDMSDYDTFVTFVPDVELANNVFVKGIQGNVLFEGIHFSGVYRQEGIKISNACDNVYIRQCFLFDAAINSGRLHAQRYEVNAGALATIYDLALDGDAILSMNQSSLMGGAIYPRDHAKIQMLNGHLSRMTVQDCSKIVVENSYVLPPLAYHCSETHLIGCTLHSASASVNLASARYGGKITIYNGSATYTGLLSALYFGSITTYNVTNITSRNVALVSSSGMISIDGQTIFGSDIQIGKQGARLIDSSGTLTVRNSADDAYANVSLGDTTVNGNLEITGDITGNAKVTGNLIKSSSTGITASTTQSQGQQQLTADINQIATVANPDDVATMPSCFPGAEITLINDGINRLQLFPDTDDNLGAGVDASITQAPGTVVKYIGIDATNWRIKTKQGYVEHIISIAGVRVIGAATPSETTITVGSPGVPEAVLAFDKNTEEGHLLKFHYIKDQDFTRPIEFHLMWKPDAAWTTGAYKWNLDYIAKDEAGDSTTGSKTTISMTVTPSNATDFIETVFSSTITMADDQVILCRFYRDATNGADTADADGLTRFYEFKVPVVEV